MNEKSNKGKNNERKKRERLQRLLGVDLCSCGGGHQLRCHGTCKVKHMNSTTGKVECGEYYQIDCNSVQPKNSQRPKRTWKYGSQKDENGNKLEKYKRYKKRERDKSESLTGV